MACSTKRSGRGPYPASRLHPGRPGQRRRRRPNRPRCASPSTATALYIGVTAFDSEPDKWLGYQRRRDEFLGSDDRFMWTIDTFLDGRSGYFFEMNPSGPDGRLAVRRQRRQPAMGRHLERPRPTHTTSAGRSRSRSRSAPLNFNPESDTWGINFQRTVRRKNEDSIWMGWARNQGLRRMTNAGRVTGIPTSPRGSVSTSSRTACSPAQASPGRGERRLRRRRQRRRRPLLQPDAAAARQPDRQHRLRADRGRSAAGQPHPLLAVLSRDSATSSSTARPSSTSPARPTRRPPRQPVLQPAHRPRRRRRRRSRSTSAPSSPGRSGGRTSASCTSAPATTMRRLVGEDFTAARVKRRHAARSPTSVRCTRGATRALDGVDGASHTAGARRAAWPPTASSARRTSRAAPGSCTPRGPARSTGNSAFGAVVDYPERPLDRRARRPRGAGRTSTRRSASSRAATTAASSRA